MEIALSVDIKKIEVQQIIINKKDLLRIAQALTEMENSELFNGES